MKKSKLVLAAASLILAGVSIAATKPIRLFTGAYVMQNGNCVTAISPCDAQPNNFCTTAQTASMPFPAHFDTVFAGKENDTHCNGVRLTRSI